MKLTIRTPERRQWHRSSVVIVNFEQINAGWVAALKQRYALEVYFDVLIQHWEYLDEINFWCFSREFCPYLISSIYIFNGYDGYIYIGYIWINLNWMNVDRPNSAWGIFGCIFLRNSLKNFYI